MFKNHHASLILIISMVIKSLVRGSSIDDALIVTALCAMHAFVLYLNSTKKPDINEDIKKELSDLKSTVNALKLGKNLGRL